MGEQERAKPRKFRRRPVVVEAVQWTGDNFGEIYRFLDGIAAVYMDAGSEEIRIGTLEGVMTASLFSWIIKGVKGEFYPCRPDIFEQTYKPVEEEKA